MQSHELKFLTSVYKQRFVHECGYFKDATSKLTSNIIPNMRMFILVMSMSYFELTLPSLINNYAKTWLNQCIRLP